MSTKPIPKSLHTVTVIVAIASDIKTRMGERAAPDSALILYALRMLGLDGVPDEHGIVAQCLKQLNRKG